MQRRNCHTAYAYDYVRRECDQFRRVAAKAGEIAPSVSNFNLEITANRPSQLLKGLLKDRGSGLPLWIVGLKEIEYANKAWASGRLSLRCNWPGRCAAKDTQKFPSPHVRPTLGKNHTHSN